MNLSKVNRILIVRLSSLGDILLTTPFIRSFKNQHPNITIDFLVRKQFEDAVKFNPHLDSVISIKNNDNIDLVKSELKNRNYDLTIDLQNNFRSRKITKNISPKIVRFKKPNLDKFLLVNFKINRLKNIIPIPVRYSKTISNFSLDNNGLELFIDESVKSNIIGEKRIIGICPGSVHKTKMWQENYFIELGKKLSKDNYQVVLLGGKSDRKVCSEINKSIPGSVDLSNDNKLFETAVNMKKCEIIICNDSGLMHTALAVKRPVVSIFGSTVKEFGFAPYGGKSLVLENNSLSCRPCSHIGRSECPKKHFKCMLQVTPDYVYQKTKEFISTL